MILIRERNSGFSFTSRVELRKCRSKAARKRNGATLQPAEHLELDDEADEMGKKQDARDAVENASDGGDGVEGCCPVRNVRLDWLGA